MALNMSHTEILCVPEPSQFFHNTFIFLTHLGDSGFRIQQGAAVISDVTETVFLTLLTCCSQTLHFQFVSSPAAGLAGFPVRRLANFTVSALG